MSTRRDRSTQSGWRLLVTALGLAAAFPVAGASIALYESDSFRGRSFVADQTISNFANVGFNDRAASVIIRSGSWQLCTDAYFRGRCVTLGPGDYPTLRSMALENQVSSARELDWLGGGGGAAKPGGRVELFSGKLFEGRAFVVDGAIANLPRDFNDRAQSMIVHDGYWEICEDIDFRGGCEVYDAGRHADLRGMANRVSSIRPTSGPGPVPGPVPGLGGVGRVELFEGPRFEGRAFAVDGPVTHFPREVNDRAQSMIVHGGYWEICENIDYRGTCQTYGPGLHANLGAMASRASSIRPASAPAHGAGAGGWGGGGGWGTGSRALLYEGRNLTGATHLINAEVVPSLEGTRFNNRASSLRVEGGYWLFCSEANFGGDCLTFGPGDYATLPGSLNNRISSGRRIHEQYPYSQNPTWPR